MEDQIDKGAAYLLGHTRLDFDSHSTSNRSIDSCRAAARAEIKTHRWTAVAKHVASGKAHQILAEGVEGTHR